jgi:hypothetical protein
MVPGFAENDRIGFESGEVARAVVAINSPLNSADLMMHDSCRFHGGCVIRDRGLMGEIRVFSFAK